MSEFNPETLRDNLKSIREKAGLSQKEVDEKFNLRRGCTYDYERGKLKLPFRMAVALCGLYKCELSDIYPGQAGDEQKTLQAKKQ